MYQYIRTLITYVLFWLISPLFVVPMYVLSWLPASVRYDNKLFYFLASWWPRLLFLMAGVRLQVVGRENIPAGGCVFAMNHASALDILVLEILLGAQSRIWLSKVGYRRVPLFRTILQRMHVIVNVTCERAAARSLARLLSLARGTQRHTLIFPEGGRFTDGKIHPFFRGFAVLARKLKRPVVPIYIGNAHRVLDPNGYLIDNRHLLTLSIGKAFQLHDDESNEQFSDRVRAWFVAQANAHKKNKEGR